MSDDAENAASRLWRDRAHVREQERNEAQARARVAEEKLAALTADNDRLAIKNTHLGEQNNRLAVEIARLAARNDRLAAEVAQLRHLVPDAAQAHAETEQQMKALRTELASLLETSRRDVH
jgi:cell division septum initiation protein DivIVA